uniref:Uncharacterized protein n=1 Tax=Chromera velia CCMP2878 TaxID=1169474 RepID=A0A0G4IEE7_9ALVE|eukprot:Cvel_13647.t1-p1 / transcript=Cvel_13647.t1 / gene=Cvel_13647 / organism=Chromera_velia_CCMP2878 / gene_product=hypothetical protein / transcript_product=hypothetical protein / location=Cvel_scaffold941:15044-17267(+) / protein_length=255 / sequence_SO=supercontig / SO=protein_coding / is_pseudo=false
MKEYGCRFKLSCPDSLIAILSDIPGPADDGIASASLAASSSSSAASSSLPPPDAESLLREALLSTSSQGERKREGVLKALRCMAASFLKEKQDLLETECGFERVVRVSEDGQNLRFQRSVQLEGADHNTNNNFQTLPFDLAMEMMNLMSRQTEASVMASILEGSGEEGLMYGPLTGVVGDIAEGSEALLRCLPFSRTTIARRGFVYRWLPLRDSNHTTEGEHSTETLDPSSDISLCLQSAHAQEMLKEWEIGGVV